jgi:hypothetical protein
VTASEDERVVAVEDHGAVAEPLAGFERGGQRAGPHGDLHVLDALARPGAVTDRAAHGARHRGARGDHEVAHAGGGEEVGGLLEERTVRDRQQTRDAEALCRERPAVVLPLQSHQDGPDVHV